MSEAKDKTKDKVDFRDLEGLITDVRLLTELVWDIQLEVSNNASEKSRLIAIFAEKKAKELYDLYHEAYRNWLEENKPIDKNVVCLSKAASNE